MNPACLVVIAILYIVKFLITRQQKQEINSGLLLLKSILLRHWGLLSENSSCPRGLPVVQ